MLVNFEYLNKKILFNLARLQPYCLDTALFVRSCLGVDNWTPYYPAIPRNFGSCRFGPDRFGPKIRHFGPQIFK